MASPHSITFFDQQFQRQLGNRELALNPFEQAALPYLRGTVLDLGCGLGNLALAAARQGCVVTALDGSPTAIAHVRETSAHEGLAIEAHHTDLARYRITRDYDAIVCIGLLMFFPRELAEARLQDIAHHVRPGGIAAVNVLIAGTTYLDMFEPGHFHLFEKGALRAAFAGWEMLVEREDVFDAPHHTRKLFDTVVARRRG